MLKDPMRAFLKALVPEGLLIAKHRHHLGKDQFSGNYSSWHDALLDSTGYDSNLIIEKTKRALLKVKNGEAVFERDSVLFDNIQYSWPLLAGLMFAATQSEGRLNVLDFGGSLGTTFFQNRKFLNLLPEVTWNVVEQPAYVKIGKESFQGEGLLFYENIDLCLKDNQPNTIVLSGVLQYLEHPYPILEQLLSCGASVLIIDRTSVCHDSEDRLCVQRVPATIFNASYPMWILSLRKILSVLGRHEIVAEFKGFENGITGGLEFLGFIVSV